tara:strand:+ start:600 stop:830 length:231 start_codon:yes stop_codon:yes gene_type:complete
MKFLFFFMSTFIVISCGGGTSNSNELGVEINKQVNTDLSSQNTQTDTSQSNQADIEKVVEEISTFENVKFDEAIFN